MHGSLRVLDAPSWLTLGSARIGAGSWLRVAVVVILAMALARLVPRLVRRLVRRVLDARVRSRLAVFRTHTPRAFLDSGATPAARYAQRAEALSALGKHLTAGAIWLVAVILVLRELHVALVTVVTGAGFLGVAVALGAQDLLRDYVAGFFMLLDDRFGVGDRVELGGVVGDIEEVTLRWTRVRDTRGTEWYVPSGQLQQVGNRSQHRDRALIDVDLRPDVHLADTFERIAQALQDLRDDPDIGSFVLEEPHILGVEALTRYGPTVRISVHTMATKQAEVSRAVLARVYTALERPAHERRSETAVTGSA